MRFIKDAGYAVVHMGRQRTHLFLGGAQVLCGKWKCGSPSNPSSCARFVKTVPDVPLCEHCVKSKMAGLVLGCRDGSSVEPDAAVVQNGSTEMLSSSDSGSLSEESEP